MSKRKAKTKPEAESKIELKPCPHCGSEKLFIFPPDDDKLFPRAKGMTYRGYVSCECGAVCLAKFYSVYPAKAREAAAAIWNRRPADELDEYVTQQDEYEAHVLSGVTAEMMRQIGKASGSGLPSSKQVTSD